METYNNLKSLLPKLNQNSEINMRTLKIILKQHTPMIHFQHEQYGAALRASEVKPKLDKFILKHLGNGNYEEGKSVAKEKQWLIGKGDHPSLNYKMRITAYGNVDDMKLKVNQRSEHKFTTERYPLLLANMGGRKKKSELVNLTMYEETQILLNLENISLYETLQKIIPVFFAINNFGQRSKLGFGSYTVSKINERNINTGRENPYFIPQSTYYLQFNIDDIYLLNNQKWIFKIIELFWSGLKRFFLKNRSEQNKIIRNYLTQKIDDNEVQRIPSPLIFKPISSIDKNNNVKITVYIFLNEEIFNLFSNEKIAEYANDIIKDYITNIIHPKFKNWRVKAEREKLIDVKFNNNNRL